MSIANVEVDKLVSKIILEVKKRSSEETLQRSGVYNSVSEAVEAATSAQKELMKHSIEQRTKYIEAIRCTINDNARMLAEMAVKESGMGIIEDKVIKNKLAANKTPGPEILKTEACSGDGGLTIVEMAPFGVIGAITPVTNPIATIVNNSIGMLSAGNSVIFSVHPNAKESSKKAIELMSEAIVEKGGPHSLLCSIATPSIETAQELMHHPGINLLTATGGPDVVKAALSCGKKAIGAGAGNPPVIVDETADIEKAARDIIAGGSFDNNLPCITEKCIIVVGEVADKLLSNMEKNKAYLASEQEIKALEKILVLEQKEESGKVKYSPNKDYVGKDAKVILQEIGVSVDREVKAVITEVDGYHPFAITELMMPVLPLVQVKNIDKAIELAVQVEHNNKHTAVIHSKNVDHMTSFARAIQTTIFVKNAPSYAGIGVGGEGYTTFTIAGPTGEGLTMAQNYTRKRRCVLVDALSIV